MHFIRVPLGDARGRMLCRSVMVGFQVCPFSWFCVSSGLLYFRQSSGLFLRVVIVVYFGGGPISGSEILPSMVSVRFYGGFLRVVIVVFRVCSGRERRIGRMRRRKQK